VHALCLTNPPSRRGTSGCLGGNGRRRHTYCRKVNTRKYDRVDSAYYATAGQIEDGRHVTSNNIK
jgi:hypothetical protein